MLNISNCFVGNVFLTGIYFGIGCAAATEYFLFNSYPLTWNAGRSTFNVNSNTWEIEFERIPAGQKFEFKVLKNDKTWSTGNNFIGTGGAVTDVYPTF